MHSWEQAKALQAGQGQLEESAALLLRAENTTADPLSGDAFSAKTPKVLCLNCDQFYAPSSTVPASLLRVRLHAVDSSPGVSTAYMPF